MIESHILINLKIILILDDEWGPPIIGRSSEL